MVYPATAMQKFRTYIFPLLFIPLSVTVWGLDNGFPAREFSESQMFPDTVAVAAGNDSASEAGSVSVDSLSVAGDRQGQERMDRRMKADSLVRAGDSLRMDYEFVEAVAMYRQALELEPDSVAVVAIENRKLQAENGASMTDYVYRPKVIARHMFSLDDFFLYYPMQDSSWRTVPNVLDTLGGHPFAKATYVPDGTMEIYYSAPDENGVRNIWRTEFNDTLWKLPALLNEQVTSPSDEVYPVISHDGKSMYFSSAGLYGMGGYDLYVSTWDEESGDWGVPVNMGFPYSSPYNDVLFYNTPDGRYTMFASDRGCPADSINVYVLEYDNMPIHGAVKDVDDLRELMDLAPEIPDTEDVPADSEASMPDNPDLRRYMQKVEEVKALKDTIFAYGVSMDDCRNRLADSDNAAERVLLEEEILRKEAAVPALNDSLRRATAALQEIEMEFLFNGVVIDLDRVNEEADREIVPKDINYTFFKMEPGDTLKMDIEQPEPEFDYSFMILPEGRFAEDNTLPEGIVYQIQIFSITHPATLKDIRGLSPVFLHRPDNGRYTYTVGLFRTYSEVLAHLNKVRTNGFRGAYIVAFRDGKSIPVNAARKLE